MRIEPLIFLSASLKVTNNDFWDMQLIINSLLEMLDIYCTMRWCPAIWTYLSTVVFLFKITTFAQCDTDFFSIYCPFTQENPRTKFHIGYALLWRFITIFHNNRASRRLKSQSTQLFLHQLNKANNKDNTTAQGWELLKLRSLISP